MPKRCNLTVEIDNFAEVTPTNELKSLSRYEKSKQNYGLTFREPTRGNREGFSFLINAPITMKNGAFFFIT